MTFSEEAAALHRLEAVAMNLGLSIMAFERIIRDVTTVAHIVGASPEEQLSEIRALVHASDSEDRRATSGNRAALSGVTP